MRNIIFAALVAAPIGFIWGDAAAAGQKNCTKISCDQPKAVNRGTEIPVWQVDYCVIGQPGHYTEVDCKSPRAVHTSPLGRPAVCFVGTDKKVHWDAQREVHVGRPFINHKVAGRWQPDWQTPPPY